MTSRSSTAAASTTASTGTSTASTGSSAGTAGGAASRTGGRPAALGIGVAIVSALAFGATGPFAKSLIDAGWTPETVVLVRILGAAVVLTPFAIRAWLAARADLGARDARSMLAYGIVAVAGVQLCFFNAVDHLPVSVALLIDCLLYTSPSPRDQRGSRMPSSA